MSRETGPRQGENHAAVRFGDHNYVRVYLNDVLVENVIEVFAGNPGRALHLMFDITAHGTIPREVWRTGNYRIERM